MRLSSDSCAEPLLPAGTGRTGMLFPPRRVLRRSAGPGAGVSDQSPDLGCRDGGGGVQAALADRAVFQSLKAKSAGEDLIGTSANALKTQVWAALIAMLLIKYLQLKATFGWSLSNLVALLRQQLFVYRDLWVWIDHPFQAPELPEALPEQLAMVWQ